MPSTCSSWICRFGCGPGYELYVTVGSAARTLSSRPVLALKRVGALDADGEPVGDVELQVDAGPEGVLVVLVDRGDELRRDLEAQLAHLQAVANRRLAFERVASFGVRRLGQEGRQRQHDQEGKEFAFASCLLA